MLERMVVGDVPAKHHTALRGDDGRLRYEECLTRDGFEGPYTIVYHRERPHTARVTTAVHGWQRGVVVDDRPLARRLYQPALLKQVAGAPIDVRTPLLQNKDVVLSSVTPTESDPTWFANADGDELFFVHQGDGTLRSPLGDVAFVARDYVFIPKGIPYRFVLPTGVKQMWLAMEFAGSLSSLKQFHNEAGQLRMDAPYCHRDFKRPVFRGSVDPQLRDVVVKRRDVFHALQGQHPVADLVGWDGAVYPWAFPILAFQPRVGLVHLPPTWHGTFAARGALVCSFVPRPVDFHPDAVPCPYPHSSFDCDEFIWYCDGSFTSRKGVGPTCISHHPAGVPHGPHPGAYEASIGTKHTSELAVMLDVTEPLLPTQAALSVEAPGYHDSFLDSADRGR